MLIFSNSLSIDWSSFFVGLALKGLRDHNNKPYKMFFLCNPYHQLSVIKDIVSLSLAFLLLSI